MGPVYAALRRVVREQLVETVEKGENPLSFLLSLVKGESCDLETRLYAAEILLPYTSPRLSPLPPATDQPAGPAPEVAA
jgi:hypothetical protein